MQLSAGWQREQFNSIQQHLQAQGVTSATKNREGRRRQAFWYTEYSPQANTIYCSPLRKCGRRLHPCRISVLQLSQTPSLQQHSVLYQLDSTDRRESTTFSCCPHLEVSSGDTIALIIEPLLNGETLGWEDAVRADWSSKVKIAREGEVVTLFSPMCYLI